MKKLPKPIQEKESGKERYLPTLEEIALEAAKIKEENNQLKQGLPTTKHEGRSIRVNVNLTREVRNKLEQ